MNHVQFNWKYGILPLPPLPHTATVFYYYYYIYIYTPNNWHLDCHHSEKISRPGCVQVAWDVSLLATQKQPRQWAPNLTNWHAGDGGDGGDGGRSTGACSCLVPRVQASKWRSGGAIVYIHQLQRNYHTTRHHKTGRNSTFPQYCSVSRLYDESKQLHQPASRQRLHEAMKRIRSEVEEVWIGQEMLRAFRKHKVRSCKYKWLAEWNCRRPLSPAISLASGYRKVAISASTGHHIRLQNVSTWLPYVLKYLLQSPRPSSMCELYMYVCLYCIVLLTVYDKWLLRQSFSLPTIGDKALITFHARVKTEYVVQR